MGTRSTIEKLLCLVIIPVVTGDECSVFVKKHAQDESAISFCNDLGFCDSVYFDSSRQLVFGSTSDIPEAQLVYCDGAFRDISGLSLIPHTPGVSERPMPLIYTVEAYTLSRTAEDDVEWGRISKFMRRGADDPVPTVQDEFQIEAWHSRGYPPQLESDLYQLETLLETVGGALQASFPRVTQDSLAEGWADEIVDLVMRVHLSVDRSSQARKIRSIFRNSDSMRQFEWCMRMVMEYSLKLRDDRMINSFFQAVSPFVFVFSFLQHRLRIDYLNLYHGMQDFVVEMSKIQPPVSEEHRWYWRLPKSMVEQNWSMPELPLLFNPDLDWETVLNDAGMALPDRMRKNYYKSELQSALEKFAANNAAADAKKQIAFLLHFADRTNLDISRICASFASTFDNILLTSEHIFPPSLATTTVAAILNRCRKNGLSLSAQLRFIDAISHTVPVYSLSHLMLPRGEGKELDMFVRRLAILKKYHLAGTIRVSLYTESAEAQEENIASSVPVSVAHWFGGLIDQLFAPEFGYMQKLQSRMDETCFFYAPHHRGTLEEMETLRGVGRLLALYLREGYAENKLSAYLKACAETNSVESVLFLGSESIRRGFYDVFVENDFELALSSATDVSTMLEFVSKRETGFFSLGFASIESV